MTAEDLAVEAPIYILHLPQASDECYFSVHQRDIRCVDAEPYIDFGVTVLRSDPGTHSYQLVASTGISADRQNQTDAMALPAGQYIVVPTSAGCVLKNRPSKTCHAALVGRTL